MKLGMVTYNMGKDMDCPTLIKFCKATGLQASSCERRMRTASNSS